MWEACSAAALGIAGGVLGSSRRFFPRCSFFPLPSNLQTNHSPKQEEFQYYMEDARSKLLVVGPGGNSAAEAAGGPTCIALTVTPPGAGSSAAPMLSIQSKTAGFEAVAAPATEQVQDPPLPDDVALFLHTSGTTSRPKGVPLTHANLVASLDNIAQVWMGGCGHECVGDGVQR